MQSQRQKKMIFISARRLSVKAVRGEDGVKCAVELIEEHLSNWRSGTIF